MHGAAAAFQNASIQGFLHSAAASSLSVVSRPRAPTEKPKGDGGVRLVDDSAALGYACDMVCELRKSAGYDDPSLAVMVGDDYRPLVFSIPFLAGCA